MKVNLSDASRGEADSPRPDGHSGETASDGPGPQDALAGDGWPGDSVGEVGPPVEDAAELTDTPSQADVPAPWDSEADAEPQQPDAVDAAEDGGGDGPTDLEEETAEPPEVVEDTGGAEEEIPWKTGGGWTWVNLANSPDGHVQALIQQAVDGMGFGGGDARGPRAEDRFVVSRHLLLWLDQTGFVGKMNGLWRLNGADGLNLDFAVRDGGRPLNFLNVGEKGVADFPKGYPGAEHVEFPNTTPEANDKPNCAEGDWCNQYAHEEASDIDNPLIPWWSACNAGTVGWGTLFEPIEEKWVGDGIRLLWEAPLVKEADGDGNWDGDACHQHWLFPDGIRRPVYLQVGYEISPDATHVDRLFRFRNPAGNPPFTGPLSVIGGFVISTWPNPHRLKEIHRWLKPTLKGFVEPKTGIELHPGIWNFYTPPGGGGDMVLAWLDQPFGMSAFPTEIAGRTAILSHVGPSDNADVGVCLCKVHGGLEMGGGLLHGGTSLPIDGGTTSVEARRRLQLPGGESYPKTLVYNAVNDFSHATGEAQGDGWSASTDPHNAGHMLYGPYTTAWCGFKGEASFSLQVDNNSADDLVVAVLDINDSTTDTILASREVKRKEFASTFQYQSFTVPFDATGFGGHTLEARVYWTDVSFVKLNTVTVTLLVQ